MVCGEWVTGMPQAVEDVLFFFFVVISIKLFFLSNIHKFTEVKSHLNTVRLPP